MLESRRQSLLFIAPALTTAAAAAFGQVDIVETDFSAETEVRVEARSGPLVDADAERDTDLVSPRAEAEAAIRRTFNNPGASSSLDNNGWMGGLLFTVNARFDLEDDRGFADPLPRSVSGSWGQRVVFDLARRVELQMAVQAVQLDHAEYTDYEPARLVGPGGEIVSGPPEPGLRAWTWVIQLQPGRYTFEAHASYGASIDGEDGLSESASHSVRMSIYPPRCRPDLDGDGELTLFDFLMFQNLFDAGDARADFDGDGELTIFDFLAFQNAFDAGCA